MGLRLPGASEVGPVDRGTTRIPNVKLGKFKVAITGLVMTPSGGKRKGIMCTGEDPK